MATIPLNVSTLQLATPQTVGDIGNQTTVSSLKITAISFQFDPALAPQMVMSVVLKDPASGWSTNVVYRGTIDGANALTWFNSTVGPNLVTTVLNKLMVDGKLPAGTLS